MTHQNRPSTTAENKAQVSFMAYALIVGTSIGFSQTVHADSCTGASIPTLSIETGTVCLPTIEVPGVNGLDYFKAELQWVAEQNSIRFTLADAKVTTATANNNPKFSPTTGIVTIPVIEQYDRFGTNRYAVELQWIANTVPSIFELRPTVTPLINPAYIPKVTWKPYVALSSLEKSTLNVLGYANPYTQLAIAAYNFDVRTIGAWDLTTVTDQSSGLQAGVYINRDSKEIVIAFRGTELCLIPIACSFSEIKESGRDSLTDTLLTQGHDSGQFNDAYLYTQQIINSYPNRKITLVGHSLGGGIAQAAGASFKLTTYAFNSSPVPNDFWDDHSANRFDPAYSNLIHVISDIHDPVSNTNHLGTVYADASHVTPVLVVDFDNKAIMPSYKTTLDSLRFNKHSMETLSTNIANMLSVFTGGW